jgi:hypothetical protein
VPKLPPPYTRSRVAPPKALFRLGERHEQTFGTLCEAKLICEREFPVSLNLNEALNQIVDTFVACPKLICAGEVSACPNEYTRNGLQQMRFLTRLAMMALAATLLGCGHHAVSKPSMLSDLTQIYECERAEYQKACRNRDEQEKVVAELEKIDLESASANPEKSHAEIAKLEDYLQRLNEEIALQANRVADAKAAMDEARIKER